MGPGHPDQRRAHRLFELAQDRVQHHDRRQLRPAASRPGRATPSRPAAAQPHRDHQAAAIEELDDDQRRAQHGVHHRASPRRVSSARIADRAGRPRSLLLGTHATSSRTPSSANGIGLEPEQLAGQPRIGPAVPDVARPVGAGDFGTRSSRPSSRRQQRGHLIDADRLAGPDVDGRPSAPRRVSAATVARATS